MPRLRPRAVAPEKATPAQKDRIDKSLKKSEAEPGEETTANQTYLGKVIAYIPIESVALYQAAFNQLGKDDPLFSPTAATILVATPFWQLWSTRNKGEPIAWDQVIVSAPAFIFWLIGLQSPLATAYFAAHQVPWKESYGTFFLIVGSLVLPVLGAIVIAVEKFVRKLFAPRPPPT